MKNKVGRSPELEALKTLKTGEGEVTGCRYSYSYWTGRLELISPIYRNDDTEENK